MDPIVLTNLILCIVIVAFALVASKKTEDKWPLWVGGAFGLFGVSHLLTLLGLQQTLTGVLITIRTIGYLLVVCAVYIAAFRR